MRALVDQTLTAAASSVAHSPEAVPHHGLGSVQTYVAATRRNASGTDVELPSSTTIVVLCGLVTALLAAQFLFELAYPRLSWKEMREHWRARTLELPAAKSDAPSKLTKWTAIGLACLVTDMFRGLPVSASPRAQWAPGLGPV